MNQIFYPLYQSYIKKGLLLFDEIDVLAKKELDDAEYKDVMWRLQRIKGCFDFGFSFKADFNMANNLLPSIHSFLLQQDREIRYKYLGHIHSVHCYLSLAAFLHKYITIQGFNFFNDYLRELYDFHKSLARRCCNDEGRFFSRGVSETERDIVALCEQYHVDLRPKGDIKREKIKEDVQDGCAQVLCWVIMLAVIAFIGMALCN